MLNRIALVRRPGPRLPEGIVDHIERVPVDYELAVEQWEQYVALLRRYDQLRKQNVVAAAALNGSRCEGCHLDLSAAELDDVRAQARAGGLADCPQCGRLLVV